ncbi:hypothetical protein BKA66DRAFT_476795 [Pyrenochaeta sp. MPI-SDFR-AT-0127]|nr:hypothetical protein BKA66DRAFT_476795 [Pyrenochaeta sp. MPI-SDFR-AT-0127]
MNIICLANRRHNAQAPCSRPPSVLGAANARNWAHVPNTISSPACIRCILVSVIE